MQNNSFLKTNISEFIQKVKGLSALQNKELKEGLSLLSISDKSMSPGGGTKDKTLLRKY
jgi:hypothetical protein